MCSYTIIAFMCDMSCLRNRRGVTSLSVGDRSLSLTVELLEVYVWLTLLCLLEVYVWLTLLCLLEVYVWLTLLCY